jgi:sec-independent protein translocase protein TatA
MPEMVIIGLICVLIFGPRQLPKLGRSLGETLKAFRGVGKELESLHDEPDDEDPPRGRS